jgi:hypothetical protein
MLGDRAQIASPSAWRDIDLHTATHELQAPNGARPDQPMHIRIIDLPISAIPI